MTIASDEVAYVARLARLDIKGEDFDTFARQIGQILGYVDTLNQVDTADVTPTSHAIDLTNALREDEVRPSLKPEAALDNAPQSEDGCFVVPKIIE
jgi:aspartyl-tRNA(Asn)/glutamyl-tRNA(Gln) amidotransferase subunit C